MPQTNLRIHDRESQQDADRRVLAKVASLHPDEGASAVQIAIEHLGVKAARHGYRQLEQIGLGIAVRLCEAGKLKATKSNRFVAARQQSEVA